MMAKKMMSIALGDADEGVVVAIWAKRAATTIRHDRVTMMRSLRAKEAETYR